MKENRKQERENASRSSARGSPWARRAQGAGKASVFEDRAGTQGTRQRAASTQQRVRVTRAAPGPGSVPGSGDRCRRSNDNNKEPGE